ncbi:MAG: hypothetical protein A2816_00535 [Candidatus Yanofskybacteria bacterium RIFCSPHIGHO2_01_FULL_39_44]|nr:MAG: hypothetical protein A2816_00535 [Candidatus Yanofskybacteria bacterium RIFCSPHIGHO2_01_FULL_39_44]
MRIPPAGQFLRAGGCRPDDDGQEGNDGHDDLQLFHDSCPFCAMRREVDEFFRARIPGLAETLPLSAFFNYSTKIAKSQCFVW